MARKAPRVTFDTSSDEGKAWQEVFDAWADFIDTGGALGSIETAGNIFKRTDGAITLLEVPKTYQEDADNSLAVIIKEPGKLTQKEGTMPDTTVGSTWNGIPTILASAGVAYSNGDVVVAKIEYEALNTSDEFTDWQTTSIEFEIYAPGSIPSDVPPVWNSTSTTWTTSQAKYYFTWATTNATSGAVTFTETGPCRVVYCGGTDVRVIT